MLLIGVDVNLIHVFFQLFFPFTATNHRDMLPKELHPESESPGFGSQPLLLSNVIRKMAGIL
jgi:hypothetical protein